MNQLKKKMLTTLVKNIKSKRKAFGWTQEELAHKAGVHVGTIKQLESFVNFPKFETLEAIAKALDTTPESLMENVVDSEFMSSAKLNNTNETQYAKRRLEVLVKNIKSKRRALKLTQRDLANKSGISYGNLKQIESMWQDRQPRPENIEAIARALDSTPEALTGELGFDDVMLERLKAVIRETPPIVNVQLNSDIPIHLREILENLKQLDPTKDVELLNSIASILEWAKARLKNV